MVDGNIMKKHIFPETLLEWIALLGVGFASFIVQISFTKALQYEMAATVSLERKAADVIFAFLYQITIFMVKLYKILYSNFDKKKLSLLVFFDPQLISKYFRKYLHRTVPEEQF